MFLVELELNIFCSDFEHRKSKLEDDIYKGHCSMLHIIVCILYKQCQLTRRINTKEKAKVAAAVSGREFIQFLAPQAILH